MAMVSCKETNVDTFLGELNEVMDGIASAECASSGTVGHFASVNEDTSDAKAGSSLPLFLSQRQWIDVWRKLAEYHQCLAQRSLSLSHSNPWPNPIAIPVETASNT